MTDLDNEEHPWPRGVMALGRVLTGGHAFQAVLLAAIVGLAFASRLYLAVSTPLVYDEYQWMRLADSVSLGLNAINLPLHGDMHPPGQVYWAALGVWIFGPNLVGYRIASVVLGTIAVLAIYFLGRRLGNGASGLFAAALLALNEYHLGVSRLITEKTYLTFAVIALLLFWRALTQPSSSRFVALGVATGLAIVTKQTAVLLVLAFGLELLRRPETRRLLRKPEPWYGLAALLIIVSPDIVWNLFQSGVDNSASGNGVAFQLAKMEPGTWSWGPSALYFRPLFHFSIEPGVLSEYVSMTSLPGALVLGSAIASVWLLRSSVARFLQAFGFATFLLFSLLSGRDGEFWWADLTVLPFVALTGGVLGLLEGRRRLIALAVMSIALVTAFRIVTTRENYFPLDVGSPPQPVIDSYKKSQWQLVVAQRNVDHLAACSVGELTLPACRFFEASFVEYGQHLASLEKAGGNIEPSEGWDEIAPERLPFEKAWASAQISRFRDALRSPTDRSGSPLRQGESSDGQR
jgi:hypothetical protein